MQVQMIQLHLVVVQGLKQRKRHQSIQNVSPPMEHLKASYMASGDVPPKDRAYKCQVCGVSKRSMESLNEHHLRRHDPQMCGICGKVFKLASTLTHHMYSHYKRKHHCDQCEFHSHFKSELDTHKITHHSTPSHQCMFPKCGRWFMRKGDLALHVETHKPTWLYCKKCEFSTKISKYLKEHMRSHEKELPYAV